jgi:hypothetical protein
MRILVLALVTSLAGCAARFADRRILWDDPDRDPIKLPAEQVLGDNWMRYRAGIFLPADRVLGIDEVREAENVNALDECPDSSWWRDRRRAAAQAHEVFGPAEVAAAPAPGPTPPFLVVQGKEIGSSRGVVVTDATGTRFILKLDAPGWFGLATATEVVVARLTAAAGWNVASVTLVDLSRTDLTVSPKATYKDEIGRKHPYTERHLDKLFEGVPRTPDGKVRVSAGRWIEGKIVGPFSYVGRRADDPNDRVAHEDRRDLRGFGVFAMWVNNIDTIEMNTLDAYVDKHLVHYQQDVGGSFGNYATGPFEAWMGDESYFSGWRVLGSIFSFGAWTRHWQTEEWQRARKRAIETWPELGWFDAAHFYPRTWAPLWRNPAFDRMTRRDRYWGLKRVLELSADEIRAAIAEGRYRPEAASRLFDILWERRAMIAQAFIDEVAPLEHLRFEGDGLCFEDLAVQIGVASPASRYEVRGAGVAIARSGATRCVNVAHAPGYHVVQVRVQRPDRRRPGPPLRVHYVESVAERHIVGLQR